VGVFPNCPSVFRLVGTLLIDPDENWRGCRRYMAQEEMNKLLNPELGGSSEQSMDSIGELLELETQNAITPFDKTPPIYLPEIIFFDYPI